MKRAKVIIRRDPRSNSPMLGGNARLVDADTGEEIKCVVDISLHMRLKHAMTATVEMLIHEVVVEEAGQLPPLSQEVGGVQVRS